MHRQSFPLLLVLRPKMCYIVHMETINIRTLHLKTGEMIRKASKGHTIVVTDRGNPVAELTPYHPEAAAAQFECRETLPAFDALQQIVTESAKYISEDRDRG